MKVVLTILALTMLLIAVVFTAPSYAQCIAEIKELKQDEASGLISAISQYTLNGNVVSDFGESCWLGGDGKYYITLFNSTTQQNYNKECIRNNKYTEDIGDNAEITSVAKEIIKDHCDRLLFLLNEDYVKEQKLIRQKELTAPIIVSIDDDLEGYKITISEATIIYKDKDIKVTYDEKNTVTNSVLTP